MLAATREETLSFLDAVEPALERFLGMLEQYRSEKEKLAAEASKIKSERSLHTGLFVERDQWSHNANFHYARYVERMEGLAERLSAVGKDEEERLRIALSGVGATEEAIAVLAGAVLQLAKQVLSFRFGAKGNLPDGCRMVGGQKLTEVIWEGRNHALHWEEAGGRDPVRRMLAQLERDVGESFPVGQNHAWAILEALEWNSVEDVKRDLNALI
jgi:hypothetical protein